MFTFILRRLIRSFQILAITGLTAFAAAPIARTVPSNPTDPARPHSTFSNRSVTLKGTASEQGKRMKATWDFGDGSQPLSVAVEHSYDVSATHTYFGAVGTEFTAKLTVEDTTTGESSSDEYRIAIREKTLNVEIDVAIDESLWYLHKAIHGDPSQATGWNLLAFERHGRLESGNASDPYTDTVTQAIGLLLKQSAAGTDSPNPAVLEALTRSGSPGARAALGRYDAVGLSQRNLGLTNGQDLPSRLLALSVRGIGRPDARWVQLESQLRDRDSLDLNTAALFELTQALRNHVSSDKPTPIQFIQSDTLGPLDWYAAEASRGDSTDGVARILVNRQNPDGSFPDAPDSTAKALLVLTGDQGGNPVINVSGQVTVTHTAWVYNRVSAKYIGNLTVTNTGGQVITGPLNVGLLNLPAGVTFVNGTGTFNGAPYKNFPGVVTMNPGDTSTVQLQFTITPGTTITFTPVTYAGPFPPPALAVACPANTGTINTPYSSSLTGTGGVQAYTFSIGPGTLPHNLTLDPNSGAITGTPDTAAPSNFTANISDSAGGTPETSNTPCTITIGSGNHAPVATPQSSTTNEDIALPLTLSGTDQDGNPLSFAIVTTPSNGALGLIGSPSCSGNPSTCTASVTYTPTANTSGSDSFTFKVNDGTVDSTAATVGITINFVNDAPSFTKGADQSANKSGGLQTVAGWATNISPGPGSNEAGQAVHFNITANSNPGIFSVAPAVSPTGTLTYTPSATTGASTITLDIQDNGGTANGGVDTSATQSFTINVNDPPQITSANNTTFAPGKVGQTFSVTTTGFPTGASMVISDGGGFPSAVALTDNHNGTATLAGTPAALTQNSSPYHVNITANNGVTPNAVQAFTLNITCPTITVSNGPGSPWQITFNFSATAAAFTQSGGNGTIAWSASGLPTPLTIASGTGVISGTPNVTGTFSATITATDAGGCTGTTPLTVKVAPVATGDTYNSTFGLSDNTQFVITGGLTSTPATPVVTAVANILTNDLPSGNVAATAGTFSTSAGGSVTLAADGTFIYTPPAHPSASAITSDSFTYTVTSNTGGGAAVTSAPGTVNLSLAGRVWYVKSGGSDSNAGQSQAPFLTLSKAVAVSLANDTLYLYSGNNTNLNTASTLKSGQSLFGQGVALVVNSNTLVAAGSSPTIGNTVTLANSVTVNGLNLSTGSATALSGSGTNLNVTVGSLSTTSAPSGINLGSSTGSLTVNGGTITTSTGDGVVLNGAVNVALSSVTVSSSTHRGIVGTGLSGFALSNSSVTNNGTLVNLDFGVYLVGTTGTVTFTTDTVTGSFDSNVRLETVGVSSAAITALTVSGGSYSGSHNNTGFQVSLTSTAAINQASITNATFSNNFSTGLQMTSNGNSTIGNGVGAPATGTATVSGCTFTGNGAAAADFDQGGANGAGNTYFRFINNLTITGNGGPTINIFNSSSSTGGTMRARIEGNHVGNAGVAQSGSTGGPGIRVFLQGRTVNTIALINNTIRQTTGSRGIDVEALGPPTTGHPITVSDITITGNNVDTNDSNTFSLADIYVAADNQGSPGQTRAEINGNTVPAHGCADYPSFDGNSPCLYYNIVTAGAVAQLVNVGGHANPGAELAATNTGTTGAIAGVTLIAGPINTVQ